MPRFLGIPLFVWVQMTVGMAVCLFILIKYLHRPQKKKTDGYLIRDVHIIVGDGSELFHQNVLVKNGIIQKISGEDPSDSDS